MCSATKLVNAGYSTEMTPLVRGGAQVVLHGD